MNLTVHCVVKNEERWVWFAINSILGISKSILIYDTGSDDKTVPIIKSIKSKKIIFEEKGSVNATELTKLRQEQLAKTNTDWFMILDGDEIWPEKTLEELKRKIGKANEQKTGVVVRAWNFVGDLYHIHPESIHYRWPFAPKNWTGWANLRVIRKLDGLKVLGNYPLEAYITKDKRPIQKLGQKKLIFLNNRYLHATYLQRSTSREKDKTILNRLKKNKIEFGIKANKDFIYPRVFFQTRPSIVADPFIRRGRLESITSLVQTPIKETRRRIMGLYNPK